MEIWAAVLGAIIAGVTGVITGLLLYWLDGKRLERQWKRDDQVWRKEARGAYIDIRLEYLTHRIPEVSELLDQQVQETTSHINNLHEFLGIEDHPTIYYYNDEELDSERRREFLTSQVNRSRKQADEYRGLLTKYQADQKDLMAD